jgi:hypothetical protein
MTSGIATSYFSTVMNGKDNSSENNNAASMDAAEKKPTINRRKREYKSSRNIQQSQPQNQQDSNNQQRPRPRLLWSEIATQSRLNSRPFQSQFRNGYFRSSYHLPLVKDSSHVPILIPGSPVVDGKPKKENHRQPESKQQRRQHRKLPLVNIAALLDTPTYYKISVTPSLDKKKQGNEGQPNATSNADAEYENFDPLSSGMTIRGHDGNKRFKAWALPSNQNACVHHHHPDYPGYLQEQQGVSQEWADRLALYLVVMERLTRKLGSVGSSYLDILAAANPRHHCNHHSSMHWNVTIYRGLAYPMEVVSRQMDDNANGQDPVPILEWAPHTNTKQQPRASIILQGDPDSQHGIHPHNTKKKKRKGPVTFVYTASFRELLRELPPHSSPTTTPA